jgi:hypothetical protein
MLGQLLTGLAPNWNYEAAIGEADLNVASPVIWSKALPEPPGDLVASTGDLVADPQSGDLHALVRTKMGYLAYYHRPHGGSFSGPHALLQETLSARWVWADSSLFLFFHHAQTGLRWLRWKEPSEGVPVEIHLAQANQVALPEGYEKIVAIYPESSIYQTRKVEEVNVAVVGETRQNEVAHVRLWP